ncbi:hypothetical protein [Piscirickettsia litoralis]|uniref:Uncharacterized protein n=1 Tax=Piscirickettsia litoralis TaxID=1891921 RepID=A0ABX3A125_9GAMM|nr:hypothetical protein [Piscirickettsia litoralis]ODN41376.1 hypothetical protein BGC07_16535 [Piscirickettsia litoralis]
MSHFIVIIVTLGLLALALNGLKQLIVPLLTSIIRALFPASHAQPQRVRRLAMSPVLTQNWAQYDEPAYLRNQDQPHHCLSKRVVVPINILNDCSAITAVSNQEISVNCHPQVIGAL